MAGRGERRCWCEPTPLPTPESGEPSPDMREPGPAPRPRSLLAGLPRQRRDTEIPPVLKLVDGAAAQCLDHRLPCSEKALDLCGQPLDEFGDADKLSPRGRPDLPLSGVSMERSTLVFRSIPPSIAARPPPAAQDRIRSEAPDSRLVERDRVERLLDKVPLRRLRAILRSRQPGHRASRFHPRGRAHDRQRAAVSSGAGSASRRPLPCRQEARSARRGDNTRVPRASRRARADGL